MILKSAFHFILTLLFSCFFLMGQLKTTDASSLPTSKKANPSTVPSMKASSRPVSKPTSQGVQKPSSIKSKKKALKKATKKVVDAGPSLAPIQTAVAFWQSVARSNISMARHLVGVPFSWDSRCRFLATKEGVIKRFHFEKAPPGLKTVGFHALKLGDSSLSPRLAGLLHNLNFDKGSSCAKEALFKKVKSYENLYFGFYILVRNNKVPTVTRVSKINGKWRVTGFDN